MSEINCGSGLPGERLPLLREALAKSGRPLRIIEAHSGMTGLIAETARAVGPDGKEIGFDGMWSSSLTASVLKGKPDIEVVSPQERMDIVQDTLLATTLPMIYDADTGGVSEVFKFTVRGLEQLGVSACIIEDKTGLKQNSLFGTERKQVLDDIDNFCEKIKAGRAARRTEHFMVIARIEALIAGVGMEEALKRGAAYTAAGADGIMIHSRNKDPSEILEFIQKYREQEGDNAKPIVVVPSSYNTIYESELKAAGVSIIIYANHMLRSSYPAMLGVAETILANGRSHEVDSSVMSIKKVLNLIAQDPLERKAEAERAAAERAAERAKNPGWQTPRANSVEVADGSAKTQVNPTTMLAYLKDTLQMDFFTGVPDSCIATFCAELDVPVPAGGKTTQHVVAPNEGASIALATGYHLATGKVPLVYLQNSGVGNVINPVMSAAHSEVYGIPMIMLIGWRGQPGTKDEPQHRVQGRLTEQMLGTMEVRTFVLPKNDADAQAVFKEAHSTALETKRPVAILAPPKTFSGKKKVAEVNPADTKPTREAAIKAVVEAVGPNDAIVATTGYTSRELYELRAAAGQTHEKDFLCVGSMGHAIAIAQGIALAQPERTVWCMDGDGAALMHLGSLSTSGSMKLKNLRHVLLNNAVHDSVGGQSTSASQEGGTFDFSTIAKASGYTSVATADTVDGTAKALAAMSGAEGPAFLEVSLALGTRGDLGRPKTTTAEAKANFMGFLGSA